MSYFLKIEMAIEHIEANLNAAITLEEVAEIAGFSMYHFHRVFKSMVGETLGDYIRKRRLTNAAVTLINSKLRIIDIALECHFESEESFARAFKKMFAITPGRYRKTRPRLSLIEKPILTRETLYHLQGGLLMEPKIIVKEQFNVVGLKYYGSNKNNEISKLWGEFLNRIGEVKNRVNTQENFGVCEYVPNYTDESQFSYIACVEVSGLDEIPPGMVGKTVAAAKYAVFTHKGPVSRMPETYRYIHGTWLPSSDQQLAESDDFELYGAKHLGPDDEHSETDIYIPIK